MTAPVARPVALSAEASIPSAYQPKPENLPLTNFAHGSDK
jgi:hypothetical protein